MTDDPLPSGSTNNNQPLHPAPFRCASIISQSSDAYPPPPVGPMTLTLHGNCARCHHHHSAAKIKVNIPRNPKAAAHVKCENCDAKWLAIGGRSTTQLSMLSVETIRPDPRATAMQFSLVDMVRSTTALAALSPVLAGIAEAPGSAGPSRRHSVHLAPPGIAESGGPSEAQPTDTIRELHTGEPSALLQRSQPTVLTPSVVRAIDNQEYSLITKKHIAHLKDSLGRRIPALHRANLKFRLSNIRQSKMAARRWGKQPVRGTFTSDSAMIPESASLGQTLSEHDHPDPPSEPAMSDSAPVELTSAPVDIAVQFLEEIANDATCLDPMDAKQKAAWVRAKYTEFTARLVNSERPISRTVAAGDAELSSRFPLGFNLDSFLEPRPPALAGVGSHLGAFDDAWPEDPSPRASNFSISERTSEAETAVETATNPSTARHSLLEFLHRERRGSGSPRPPSVSTFTTQRLRPNEPHVRFSMGSQAMSEQPRRSFSRPRSSATDRYSQGSAPRSSLHLSMSQTSLTSLSVRS